MIDARAWSIDVLARAEATSPSFIHQERQGREGGVESDREKMIDGRTVAASNRSAVRRLVSLWDSASKARGGPLRCRKYSWVSGYSGRRRS